MQICFDLFSAHDIERLFISQLLGLHMILVIDVKDILEERLFPRSSIFLINIDDFW